MEEGQLVFYLLNHFVQFLSIHLLRKEFLSSWNTWAQVHGQAKRGGSFRKLVWFPSWLYLTWQSICSEVLDSQSLCWQKEPQYRAVLQPLQVSLALRPQFQQLYGRRQKRVTSPISTWTRSNSEKETRQECPLPLLFKNGENEKSMCVFVHTLNTLEMLALVWWLPRLQKLLRQLHKLVETLSHFHCKIPSC